MKTSSQKSYFPEEKPHGTIFKGTPRIVRVFVQAIRSSPRDLRGR